MHLALEGLVRLCWSQQVQDEWIAAYLQAYPNTPPDWKEHIRSLPSKMALALEFQEPVVEGYEPWNLQVQNLPDPKDAHVVAA